ncbi:MAG: DUF262 domain-containing protein [Nitrospirota bacterium]
MKKKNAEWSIEDLQRRYKAIEFPEFQREPTVWDLDKKRKLIDSILRNFDIASIYLHKRDDGIYECIDGRQRINAILSFLGLNEGKEENEDDHNKYDNKFVFKSSDELLGGSILSAYDNKTWEDFLNKRQHKEKLLNYIFNVIEITDIDKDEEELNLMFLRLQLGAPLNAGEKLNAMVGDMKEFVFKKLGKHEYFDFLRIPKKRFSKELTAAQIALNFFSLNKDNSYGRARFVDLQDFFKKNLRFTAEDKKVATLLKESLDEVYRYLENSAIVLKNRAIGVTVFFFLNDLIQSGNERNIRSFLKFLSEFLKRLKSQVEKGIDIETRYRDLLKFQTYISQAAVEKYAIENRQKFLEDYFDFYLKYGGKIKGDR